MERRRDEVLGRHPRADVTRPDPRCPSARPTPARRSASRPLTRVGFDETDAQGVVYYGRYMPYFDRARVEYLRHLGLLAASPGAFKEFVMRAQRRGVRRAGDLRRPAGGLRARRAASAARSVGWEYAAERGDGTLLCTAEQTLVQIDLPGRRPVAVADDFRERVDGVRGGARRERPRRRRRVEAVERIVEREGEADEILRGVVAELAERYEAFAGVRFVEEGELVLGPAAGRPGGEETSGARPVPRRGGGRARSTTAELHGEDIAAWSRIAELVSPYCLVGWDTGGEGWEP